LIVECGLLIELRSISSSVSAMISFSGSRCWTVCA
jgi:hypothetical protein